ncbi:MAG: hypothetical protein K1X72_17310 [Pyrinomonadaceae bacterium]|nr:hypothetical protein [Pyrinomonadaceae bacterium]
MNDEIPTVAFCEMVKHPQKYFDKTIRVTAAFTQADEGQYLDDEKNCPLSHDDQIGAGYSSQDEKQIAENNENSRKIGSVEFGGHALVTVVGNLKNQSRCDFAWYRYRFDIARFEKVTQVIREYKGELNGTVTYRAEVQPDKNFDLYFVKPYRLPLHYALRLEWTNLKDFPDLKDFQTKQIIFTILSNEIKQMTENRCNVTIRCKIIRIE